jgi:hypothetical protein
MRADALTISTHIVIVRLEVRIFVFIEIAHHDRTTSRQSSLMSTASNGDDDIKLPQTPCRIHHSNPR